MLKTIQAGRGLAALAVVAFHLSIGMGDPRFLGHPVLERFTSHGSLGVDFFFVLSGFIIVFVHERDIGQPTRWLNYLRKRFIRLYPIYWLYTSCLCVLLILGFGTVKHLDTHGVDLFSTFSLIRLNNFAPVLGPAWTLFHEVGFYAVFSLLILNRGVGIALFALWEAVALLHFTYAPELQRTPFDTYFSAYNLDFAIGMGAYFLWRRAGAAACRVALWAGVCSLVAILGLGPRGGEPHWFALAYALAFGAILAGAVSWESRRGDIRLPLLSQLGNASYTIYLTHEVMMSAILKHLLRLRTHPYVLYGIVLFLTLALGYAAFWAVERPLLEWLRQKAVERSPRSIAQRAGPAAAL